ncbi:hypothetical protein [Actinomycetospora aeridis]|uniref:Uncharacterized protein n=1 Tax=Actinomycetospora aeridis TaxID=3129231 RepID=A0ABU8N5P8_9PSEU
MFGRKTRSTTEQAPATATGERELVIPVMRFSGTGWQATCPYGTNCPLSPRPGVIDGIVIGFQERDEAVAAMDAHLEHDHGVPRSTPRRVSQH